jgi:hypothetical protein
MGFQYPVNVICFNRPEYLKELLVSMKNQTVQLSEESIFFWVDGFVNSKDESLGRKDKTSETVALIKDHFPLSKIETSKESLGIARNYWRAEENSFEKIKASSAFFLEEDLILSPHYFDLVMKMDLFFNHDLDVSHFSPTGDVSHTSSSPKEYFQSFGHNWGYLLRGWHHSERKELLKEYLNFVIEQPYYMRGVKQNQILEHFYKKGVILAGTSQDAIKDGLRNYFGRISVTTIDPWASNVGVEGEHFQFGSRHHNRPIANDLSRFPKSFNVDSKPRLLLDGKNKTVSQVFLNYLGSLDGLVLERNSAVAERDAASADREREVAETNRVRDAAVAERNSAVAERNSAVEAANAVRDAAVAERNSAVEAANAVRDAAVAERNSAVEAANAVRDAAVAERNILLNSTIWRSTKFIRAVINYLKKLTK